MLLPHVSRMAQKSEGQILRFRDILEIVSSRRLLRGSLVVGRRGSLTLCRCLSRRSLTLSPRIGTRGQSGLVSSDFHRNAVVAGLVRVLASPQ